MSTTDHGIELLPVYVGPEGVLTGTARVQQTAREEAAVVVRQQEVERRRRELERKRAMLEARLEALRAEFEAESADAERLIAEAEAAERALVANRRMMARMRGGAPAGTSE